MHLKTMTVAFALVFVAACDSVSGDTGGIGARFCERMTDADSYLIEEGGSSGTSGKVVGRLITDISGELHDPNLVGSVDYTIENLDVGGTQQTGKTTLEGEFNQVLGQGNWIWKHSADKGGYECANQFEFEVVGGDTSYVCIDAGCL